MDIPSLVFAACTLGAAAFAWIAGGTAERIGAALVLLGWLATLGVDLLLGSSEPEFVFIIIDGVMFLAFGVLMFRYDRTWAGVAACFMGLLLAFEGSRMFNFPLSFRTYLGALNLSGYGVLAALVVGAAAARRRRRTES